MEHRFIGRNGELDQLRKLWDGGQHKIIGIYGLKSVGKTRLLKEFISELKKTNPDLKVLEFDFNKIKTFKRFFKLFLKGFEIDWNPNKEEKDENEITDDIFDNVDKVLDIIKQHNSESTKACIFVLNNLENAMPKANRDGTDPGTLDKALWDNIWEDIFQKLIPNSYLFIDSTRHAKFARYANVAKLIDLDRLEDEAALELLREITGDSVQFDGDDVPSAIANLCFGLPMAVINAGQQLTEGLYSAEEMIYLLTRETIKIVSDEFLESDHKIDRSLHTNLSRLSKTDRENLVSLAFAINEQGQHSMDTEMDIEKLTEMYGFETVAEFKMNFVSKYRYNGMMKFKRPTQTISCHPILQKYLLVGKAVESLREGFKDKVKEIILGQVENLHKDSIVKERTESERPKKNSDDEAIVAHPEEETDKVISKSQYMIEPVRNKFQGNDCIVVQPDEEPKKTNYNNVKFFQNEINRPQTCLPAYTKSDDKSLEDTVTVAQPVEEPRKSNPDQLEFFKKEINSPQTCLPAYTKSDEKSLDDTVIVAQPVDDEDYKNGDLVEGFFQNPVNTPATCLPAIPKEPDSDVKRKNNISDMEERQHLADYRGQSKGTGNVKLQAGNSDIRRNLKGISKPKYLQSKSLSDSEIEVNGKNNKFQNDLSKSDYQMNIIADIKSLEENDKLSSSDSRVHQRVATVHPYHKSCDTVRETQCSKQNIDCEARNGGSQTADATEVKEILNSDDEKKKRSSTLEDTVLPGENVYENCSKPSQDGEPLDIAGSGLDPNSLLSDDTTFQREDTKPTEQVLQQNTTENPSGSNSSHVIATAKEVMNRVFKPFLKPKKTNGNVEDI